jgi:hypothetical protein
MRPETRVGYDYAHAVVDDHTRLAYVELHDDEKAATVTGFVERALAFFAEHGIIAKRLMSDNAFAYVNNRSLRELLARHGIRHLTTEPYRPRTNGKIERFHQTMAREWSLRAQLPLTPPTQPSTATPARALQHHQTAQLDRRPATTQPRSTSVGRTPSHGASSAARARGSRMRRVARPPEKASRAGVPDTRGYPSSRAPASDRAYRLTF